MFHIYSTSFFFQHPSLFNILLYSAPFFQDFPPPLLFEANLVHQMGTSPHFLLFLLLMYELYELYHTVLQSEIWDLIDRISCFLDLLNVIFTQISCQIGRPHLLCDRLQRSLGAATQLLQGFAQVGLISSSSSSALLWGFTPVGQYSMKSSAPLSSQFQTNNFAFVFDSPLHPSIKCLI